jgi:hypothetical protein
VVFVGTKDNANRFVFVFAFFNFEDDFDSDEAAIAYFTSMGITRYWKES